jgi:porin
MLVVAGATPGFAADATDSPDAEPANLLESPRFGALLFLPTPLNPFSDFHGLRTALGEKGFTLGLQEISEILGNVSGGVRRGADYDGLTTMSLGVDTAKAFGWDGGAFEISAFQIHGRDLTADNLRVLQTVSSIEAQRATRLWELWFQQTVLGGALDAKAGQQSLDQEFMVSQYSTLFINAAMGWPILPTADLYAGGPAYPLSSLGLRVRGRPSDDVTILAGVFDDNPPGGPFNDDSQLRDGEASGTRFNLGTGALFIAELQYAINPPPAEGAPPASGLPGTYKIGAWYDTAKFPDQRFDNAGLSLANPASSGMPLEHSGDFSLYAMADQMVWQPDPKGPQAVAIFARAMGAPTNENLISFGFDAGINVAAPLPGRDKDNFGIGYGLAVISARAAALDRDAGRFTGTAYPVRSNEQFVEITYQIQIMPWWQLQPDFQYVFNPGGGILNSSDPTERIKDEAVVGVRTTITF